MTFAACLARLEAEGIIDAGRVERYRSEYDRLNSAYSKTMGKFDAENQATFDGMEALEFAARNDRRQKLKQINVQRGLLTSVAAHVEGGGRGGQFAAAVMDHHEAVPGIANISNRRAAIRNLAWSRMDKFIERYKRNLLGVVAKRAELEDVARILRGEKVDNANAKLIANAVSDTFENLRLQFNRAGGAIPKLTNWGLPQRHDALMIGKAGLDAWKAYIRPLLDTKSMIDNTTGKAFVSDKAIDEALDAAWRNISSEGMDGTVPGAFNGQGKTANRRTDHRFLVFKDTDSWLAYNKRFGTGDIFDAITGHIDSMSRDISAMQVLGPNPGLTVRWLGDILKQDALPTMANGKSVKLEAKAADGADLMDRMWGMYTGEATVPHSRGKARFWQGVRNWNVATKLGRAFVTAFFTDPAWAATNAKFNGLPVMKTLGNYLGAFNPADASHRSAARSAGIVMHELTQRTESMWREGSRMRFNLYELSNRAADATLRATFLTPHTVAMKEANALSFMGEWAELSGKKYGELGDGARLAFERYGINERDWDLLRSTALAKSDGPTLLRPGDLTRRGDVDPDEALSSAVKFFELMDAEQGFRVPGESLRARTEAATFGGGIDIKRGTHGGEMLYSVTQFKTFGIDAMMKTMQRGIYGQGALSGANYAMRTLAFVTIGGMLAEQFLTIGDGKDPLPFDEKLLAKGMMRGGGFGLAGDFIGGGINNDRGQTVAGFVTGPTLATVVDPLVNLTLGNVGELARGEDTNAGREAVRFLKNNIPGGNAWYAKTAMNRMLLDELDAIADPDVNQAWARMDRRAQDQGTGYYWQPGEAAPDRGVDFGNGAMPEGAFGGAFDTLFEGENEE